MANIMTIASIIYRYYALIVIPSKREIVGQIKVNILRANDGMVDMAVLEAAAERHGGSNPPSPTISLIITI